jgi:aspartate kinase
MDGAAARSSRFVNPNSQGGDVITQSPVRGVSHFSPVVVQKYGGTSVASLDHIRRVALRALAAQRGGGKVVVVVSAMSGETNRLLGMADALSELPDRREREPLAAAGEQITASLTALAIRAAGGQSRSFLGHQVRILTDSSYGDARIREVETRRIEESLERGEIPVVAGFQGVDPEGNITTLGRGGSDTTAVAIAAALGASACEIYTDVDGVYSADPNLCASARKLPKVPYRQMLELAVLGAKVLHPRSVGVAMQSGVRVHVRSSFSDVAGTWVLPDAEMMESSGVTSVAVDSHAVELVVSGTYDVAAVALALGAEKIPLDGLAGEESGVSFLIRGADAARAGDALTRAGWMISETRDVAKVSLVGTGLQSEPAMLARLVEYLRGGNIPLRRVFAAETRLTAVVDRARGEEALVALHDGFEVANGRETSGGGK